MQKILKIAQREYIETIKTKTFLMGLFLAPVITVAIIFFSNKVSQGQSGPRPAVKVAVTDLSNLLADEIKNSFDKHNDSSPKRQILLQPTPGSQTEQPTEEQGKADLRSGKTDAYVILDKDIIDGTGKVRFYTYRPKPTNLGAFWTVERIVNNAVTNQRCRLRDLSPEVLAEIRYVGFERIEIGADTNQQRVQSKAENITKMMVPFFFMFLIYMGMVGIGQQMISSVIEEKGSRVIEVLLSAVSPFGLMAGKILGLAGIGLTVMALWAGAAFGAASRQGLDIEITGQMMFYFALYYILGFLLFSSILAGIGSVCNTLKETQSLMMPIMLIFIVPMISWHNLVQSPDGLFARVLSFIPPVTPLVMILRLSAGSAVSSAEIGASILVLVAAIIGTMWLAGRIFKAGILMYGKRPSLRQIFHWLKQS